MLPLSYQEVDSSILKLEEIKGFQDDPNYRRATSNMILAHQACAQILNNNPHIKKYDLSFVLGTAFGEVESSLNFLKTYKEEGLARPHLFQNSLHNSTLGFVTLQLGLTGPSITVSQGAETQIASERVASTLLSLTKSVLICVVDVVPEDLIPYYKESFPNIDLQLSMARCWIWKREETKGI